MVREAINVKLPRCTKCIFCAFLFVFLVILLMNTGVSKHIWIYNRRSVTNKDSSTIKIPLKAQQGSNRIKLLTIPSKLNISSLSTQEKNTFKSLGEGLTTCFIKPALDIMNQKSFTSTGLNPETVVGEGTQTYLYMIFIFNQLLASLDVRAAIIEPSVLHCLLNSKHKELLKKRNVSIADVTKTRITYGILEIDAAKLQKEESISKFRRLGYQPQFNQVPRAQWMLRNKTDIDPETYTSHIFYMYFEWIIHIVVFQKRSNYLWHAAFDSDDFPNVPKMKDLLFVNFDAAYEKFSFVPLEYKYPSLTNIYIPTDPQHFLYQIPSSRFLECNLSRAANVLSSNGTPTAHSYLSVEKFNSRALASLLELKTIFNPLLMHFWIFSGTMLGWFRQCDVIPYTTDVDFGAWAFEIDDLDYIIKYFRSNKELKIIERMGVLEEALEFQLRYKNLRVDVFFMYKINNGSWASAHRPSQGYYFRYHYPPFSLCSAELLGQKVNVPCETEEVIVSEYGSKWMTPVSSWNYESSIKNRGPNIYWDKKRRGKAFQEY